MMIPTSTQRAPLRIERIIVFLPEHKELDERMATIDRLLTEKPSAATTAGIREARINLCIDERRETNALELQLASAYVRAGLAQFTRYIIDPSERPQLTTAMTDAVTAATAYTQLQDMMRYDLPRAAAIAKLNPSAPTRQLKLEHDDIKIIIEVPILEYKLDKGEGSKLYGVPDPVVGYALVSGPLMKTARDIIDAAAQPQPGYRAVAAHHVSIYKQSVQEYLSGNAFEKIVSKPA